MSAIDDARTRDALARTGHYRALNVIAQWFSEALGVTDEGDDR